MNTSMVTRDVVDDIVHLGRMALSFGRVMRATYHEDGRRRESDTDHTVMLALVACAFAARFFPRLDLGKVAQFAIVHDLVETYAGDVNTLHELTPAERARKGDREHQAWYFIKNQLTELPWVADTIREYEAQDTPEARYVKGLDKLLPKITHLLNGGTTITESGMSREELSARYLRQATEIAGYAGEFTELFDLRADLVSRVMSIFDRKGGGEMAECEHDYPEDWDYSDAFSPTGFKTCRKCGHTIHD